MLYFWIPDLSKAFDSVPHERLLLKLNRYGIDGQLYLWFRNFLTNRRQRVQIRGSYSEWSPVISGVPQDSILGPIMFLIYVKDIPNITSTAKLFADDTKIYRQINKVLAFLILSPPLQNFHVILPTKKSLLCFFISRSRSLLPFFSLSFAGLPPTFSFSLCFSCSIFQICGHEN